MHSFLLLKMLHHFPAFEVSNNGSLLLMENEAVPFQVKNQYHLF